MPIVIEVMKNKERSWIEVFYMMFFFLHCQCSLSDGLPYVASSMKQLRRKDMGALCSG